PPRPRPRRAGAPERATAGLRHGRAARRAPPRGRPRWQLRRPRRCPGRPRRRRLRARARAHRAARRPAAGARARARPASRSAPRSQASHRGRVRPHTTPRSPYDREILPPALPPLGALAAEPLYVLADTAIVGHLGRPQLAALGLAGAVL